MSEDDDVVLVQSVCCVHEDHYEIEPVRQLAEQHAWRAFNEELAKDPDRVVLDAAVGRWRRAHFKHAMEYRVVAWTIPAADVEGRHGRGGERGEQRDDAGGEGRLRRGAATASTGAAMGEEELADTP